jgi:hypothetical protein
MTFDHLRHGGAPSFLGALALLVGCGGATEAADESRTWAWVLERSDEELLFTHEHAREDGTLYDNSGWGGWASDTGTALLQDFPDHR